MVHHQKTGGGAGEPFENGGIAASFLGVLKLCLLG